MRDALGLLLLVVFGIKAAIFPLFFWLPDSYPTAIAARAILERIEDGSAGLGRAEELLEVAKRPIKKVPALRGHTVVNLFMEPSTRTRLSFETAVRRLGARSITVADAKSSSAAKGESLADMGKTVEGYVDCIIVRQPQTGGAKIIADAVEVPVLNGGDGSGQHPTQALLDLYTIQKEKGTLENLTIGMVGDLKYGRTVHSLSYAMAPFNPSYIYCSPKALAMPDHVTALVDCS